LDTATLRAMLTTWSFPKIYIDVSFFKLWLVPWSMSELRIFFIL